MASFSPTYALRVDGVDAAPERERHFRYFSARSPSVGWSVALAFGIGACLLAASAAGQRAGIIGFAGLTGIMALVFPHSFVRAIARNTVLLVFPLWSLFSVAWSIDPDRTVHMSTLLLPTIVAGLAVGGMLDRRGASAGLALALTGYIGYSLLYGASLAFSDTGAGGEAFAGITTGKNYFGHLSAMTLMMTPAYLPFAKGRWTMPVLGFAGVSALLSGYALLKSYATGSLIATVIAFGAMVTVLMFRRIAWPFRVALIAAALGAGGLYMVFGQQLQEELFATIMQQFKKDVTLTGRTVLWDYADRLIATHFWLGYGSGAFWYWTNPEALTLWRMMGVAPMSGFNFHNTMRETLIDVGLIGLILYLFSYGSALLRTTWRALTDGDLVSAVGVGFLAYFVVRMPVESTGIGAVTIDSIIILMFLSVPAVARASQIEAERRSEAASREPSFRA